MGSGTKVEQERGTPSVEVEQRWNKERNTLFQSLFHLVPTDGELAEVVTRFVDHLQRLRLADGFHLARSASMPSGSRTGRAHNAAPLTRRTLKRPLASSCPGACKL